VCRDATAELAQPGQPYFFAESIRRSPAHLVLGGDMKHKNKKNNLQTKANPLSPLLTVPEQVALLAAFQTPHGKGFTEAEADVLFRWATEVRLSQGFLENALLGLVQIRLRQDGELEFEAAVTPDEAAKKLTEAEARLNNN
jgi:hypothetical protein